MKSIKFSQKLPLGVIIGATIALSACVVAPPHMRYGAQVNVAVPVSPVPPPPQYYVPDPAPVVVNPWIVPYFGLNFWWNRPYYGGHGHHH